MSTTVANFAAPDIQYRSAAVVKNSRITSIDLLRGIVMIIMALDHTRDYFHADAFLFDPTDLSKTNVLLFLTRWITHFCAPVFVMLSGLSAYLSAQKKNRTTAGNFYIKRGLWLILVEVTVVTFGLTFNPNFNFIILQVIWAIGCSMVLLGLLMRFSYRAIFIVGLVLLFGHNLTDYMPVNAQTAAGVTLTALLTSRGAVVPLGNNHFIGVFYAVLPWTGIMFLGFSMGRWYATGYVAALRKGNLLISGALLTLMYVVLRFARGYGDPVIWENGEHAIYSFLNTSKYPPSLQYSGMTLGPALLLLAAWDNLRSGWSRFVSVYGRVPFFYYILHFYLLHTLLVFVFFGAGFTSEQIIVPESIFAFRPPDFGYSLAVVYLVWLAVVLALYLPCRCFYKYKLSHTQWWLKYV